MKRRTFLIGCAGCTAELAPGRRVLLVDANTADAPDQYGILTVDDAGAEYHTETVDVSAWAGLQESTDPELLDFAGYAERFFRECSRDQAMEELTGRPDAAELAD